MLSKPLSAVPARQLILAVVVFVLLDLAVLLSNFWIAREVDRDSTNINLAGRQRMLSQRITKSLLLARDGDEPERSAALRELAESQALFEQTLSAFRQGGQATGGDGRRIVLAPLQDPQAARLAVQAEALWHPLDARLGRVLAQRGADPATLDTVTRDAVAANLALLELMNRLTSRIEEASGEATRRLRYIQTGALLLALLNFGVVLALLQTRYRLARRRGSLLLRVIDQVGAGVCVLDRDDRVLGANRAAGELLQVAPESLAGKRLDEFLTPADGVCMARRPDGSNLVVEPIPGHLGTDEGPVAIVTLVDVTDRHKEAERLRHLADHDPLTGLPNRRRFGPILELELARAQRNGEQLALALLDLDGFKPANDQHGHEAGDTILRTVAERLRGLCRVTDVFARLGGDEFVGLFPSLASPADLEPLAERILAAVAAPLRHADLLLEVRASIGIAVYPQDGSDAESLLRAADAAMYQIKEGGGAGWRRATLSGRRPGDAGPATASRAPERTGDPGAAQPDGATN